MNENSDKKRKQLGIREIAKLANVSVATVSRVINNPEKTHEKTRDKVNNIIQEYNYTPNLNAKSLFSLKSNSFALFVYDIENPFFTSFLKELSKLAFKCSKTLVVCDTENNEIKEKKYLEYCEGIRTRGIIVTEGASSYLFSKKLNQKIVMLDRCDKNCFSNIRSNNTKGMNLIVDYLYNLNHRAFAFVGYNEKICSSQERKEAFISRLKTYGINVPDNYIFKGDMIPDTGIKALEYFSKDKIKPSVLVCANDSIAMGIIAQAFKMGIKIPEDVSVTGFDSAFPDYYFPKITSIKQDIVSLAKNAFECIFDDGDKVKNVIVDVDINIGETCGKIK